MATPIIGTNVKVEVQSTVGSDLTVTGITLANPGVATSTSHGLSNGDVVVFSVTSGMVELDGQAVRVSGVATNTFNLEGIDTTNYSAWVSGTCKEVTAWATMDSAQDVTMPNPTPNKIETTALLDKTRQYVFGLPDAPDGSIKGMFNPTGSAETKIYAATKTNSTLAFRITFAAGQKVIFNALVSGGTGFDLSQNALATATTSFTPKKDVLFYAS